MDFTKMLPFGMDIIDAGYDIRNIYEIYGYDCFGVECAKMAYCVPKRKTMAHIRNVCKYTGKIGKDFRENVRRNTARFHARSPDSKET